VRDLELLLLGASALAVIWPAIFGLRSKRGIVFVGLLGAVIAQLVVEGYRWQILLLIITALAMAVGDLLGRERRLLWWRRVSRPLLGLVGLGMVALPAQVLPVPALPPPGGPLAIGTQTFELTFPEREEPYGANPGFPPRRIVVQVWYPAEVDPRIEPPTWNPDLDVVGPALSRRLGLPGFFFSHTRYVAGHALPNATPLPGTFPVVLYSHGWTGFRTIALNQLESLASRGYVVIAPDHTYGAVVTRFPDGRVTSYDRLALPDEKEVGAEEYAKAATLLVKVYADDLVGIIDALSEGAGGPFGELASHADTGRIGIYGHSTGGGAAIRVCLSDERCTAVLGMDPWVEPIPDRLVAQSAARPMMFMRSDGWRGDDNDGRLRGIAERSETVTYWIGIDGASHNDFVLAPLFAPIANRLGLAGPIPSSRVVPIIDRFLVGFFDVYLLGTGTAAIEQAPFSEVSLEIIDNRSP
jgi:dienelactone hydrolase